MHTLSLFPRLLDYMLLAPLLLRLAVGILRLMSGFVRWKGSWKWLSILHILSSVMIIIGLYTQLAVLIGILLVLIDYYLEKKRGPIPREKVALSVIIIVILLSLLFTGPGAFAFDLPL